MTVNEIREKYLKFYEARGHTIIPSAPLVPENDPTTLFTGSGMQPLVPYLLGQEHPEGKRLVNSQKAFRSGDIEEVGDNRHTTFFEMLGNWSLGDYFKEKQLPQVWEFLTQELGIQKDKLWVTCFEGEPSLNLPKDTESADIWKSIGVAEDRIKFYPAKKNWWSRAGVPENMPTGEPGGPDSEIFYDFGIELGLHEKSEWKDEQCHPNCDCGRFLEIGNSVFMEYVKQEDGSFAFLPKKNVDFGGGLERIAMAVFNSNDIFEVNHKYLLDAIEEGTKTTYSENIRIYRIIADHIKAAVFLIGDGVSPGNKDQGYFVRRLLRRCFLLLNRLQPFSLQNYSPTGMSIEGLFHAASLVNSIIEAYEIQYPELKQKKDTIIHEIYSEETIFLATLARGLKEFERFTNNGSLSSQDTYQLVTTYGFPLELILEEAGERGIKQIDIEGFKELLKKHQDLSRAGSEQKFKGGLADTSDKTMRLHTAHHLLLKALQTVLGPEVHQRGSNITQERLRIDFNWPQKVTKEQLAEVEKIVNEKIGEDLPVVRTEMDREDAEKLGAEHEFGAKYPDRVSIYSMGPLDGAFSIEFCGGPHVEHTGQLKESGVFKIQKEEAVAQGIRRIKAVLQ